MAAVHLCMMELERDGKGDFSPLLAITAPHHHRIAELISVLVDNAIQFCLYHGRCADNHMVIEKRTLAFSCCVCGQILVIVTKLLQIVGVGNVARVNATPAILHDDVDSKTVVLEQFSLLGQHIELLDATGRLSYAPTKEHIEPIPFPFTHLFTNVTIGMGDDIHRSNALARLVSLGLTACFILVQNCGDSSRCRNGHRLP